MGRFEDGGSGSTLDAANGVYFLESDVNELAQAKGANVAGLQVVVRPVRHRVRRHRRVLPRRRVRPAPEDRRVAADRPDPDICRTRRSSRSATRRSKARASRCCRRTKRAELEALVRRVEHCRLETHPRFFDFFVDGCQFTAGGSIAATAAVRGMIELVDTSSGRATSRPAEYQRLLGYPRDHVLEGRARGARGLGARRGTREHGRPWMYAREAADGGARRDGVDPDRGRGVSQPAAAKTLAGRRGRARRGAGGGRRRARRSRRRRSGCGRRRSPTSTSSSRSTGRRSSSTRRRWPAPGCAAGRRRTGWRCCRTTAPGIRSGTSPSRPRCSRCSGLARQPLPGPLRGARLGDAAAEEVAAGGVRPDAPRGSACAADATGAVRELLVRAVPVPPGAVSRDARIHGARVRRGGDRERAADAAIAAATDAGAGSTAAYTVNAKALRRWAAERLKLTPADDGTVDALFRYDGTTCTNMGRPLRSSIA